MSALVIHDVEQRSDDWYAARLGIVTASAVGQLVTPTLRIANNDVHRGYLRSLAAERITGRVEPTRQTQDMLRGILDEPLARDHYSEHRAPVAECGLMVRDDDGVRLGYSPDGLVGDDGLIEIKSRAPKKHLATILDDEVPAENMAQIQAGLYVSGRDWCDYISWCGGMPMWVVRVAPDEQWQAAIYAATQAAEHTIRGHIATYEQATTGLPPTEYTDHFAEAVI